MATSRRKTDEEIAASNLATGGLVSAEEVEAQLARQTDTVPNIFDHDALAGIESFADAMRLATEEFGSVISAHEDPNLGTGFRLTTDEDKYRLIGVPLLLLDWRFNPGDYAEDYVSIHAIQQDESGKAIKLVINDGGSGIAKDLREYSQKTGRKGGLFCRKGLRVSEYDTDVETGLPLSKMAVTEYHKTGRKTGRGKTFYLSFDA